MAHINSKPFWPPESQLMYGAPAKTHFSIVPAQGLRVQGLGCSRFTTGAYIITNTSTRKVCKKIALNP